MATASIRLINKATQGPDRIFDVAGGSDITGKYPVWIGNNYHVWGENNDFYYKRTISPYNSATKTMLDMKTALNIFPTGTITGMCYDGRHIVTISQRVGFPSSSVDVKQFSIDGILLNQKTSVSSNDYVGLCYDGRFFYCIDRTNGKLIQFQLRSGTFIITNTYGLALSNEQDIAYLGNNHFMITTKGGKGSTGKFYFVKVIGNNTAYVVKTGASTTFANGIETDGREMLHKFQ